MPGAMTIFFGVFRAIFQSPVAAASSRALNRHADYGFGVRTLRTAFTLAFLAVSQASAQQETSLGTVQGVVVDLATGAPLSRVLVEDASPRNTGQPAAASGRAVSGTDGRFTLTLPAGPRRLRASVVGYAISLKDVTVLGAGSVDVTILLAGG